MYDTLLCSFLTPKLSCSKGTSTVFFVTTWFSNNNLQSIFKTDLNVFKYSLFWTYWSLSLFFVQVGINQCHKSKTLDSSSLLKRKWSVLISGVILLANWLEHSFKIHYSGKMFCKLELTASTIWGGCKIYLKQHSLEVAEFLVGRECPSFYGNSLFLLFCFQSNMDLPHTIDVPCKPPCFFFLL